MLLFPHVLSLASRSIFNFFFRIINLSLSLSLYIYIYEKNHVHLITSTVFDVGGLSCDLRDNHLLDAGAALRRHRFLQNHLHFCVPHPGCAVAGRRTRCSSSHAADRCFSSPHDRDSHDALCWLSHLHPQHPASLTLAAMAVVFPLLI